MKPLLLILLLCSSVYCQPSTAQDAPEFGEISEIAGKNKVYVYSDDLKVRQRLVDKLKKASLFEIVGDTSEAEFAIYYSWSGLTTWSAIGGARTNAYKGDLMVYTRSKSGENSNRIIWSTQASRKTTMSQNPADKAIERFIKDFKAAQKAAAKSAK